MTFSMDYTLMYSILITGDRNALQDIYMHKREIQQDALNILNAFKAGYKFSFSDKDQFDAIMKISNVIYNNFDAMTPIEDGIYDQLMVAYKALMPTTYQIGGVPIPLSYEGNEEHDKIDGVRCPIVVVDGVDDFLFKDELTVLPPFDINLYNTPGRRSNYEKNENSSRNIPHNYPKLVGTLDKCKFTLISEAQQLGLLDDPTIKIFERDFLGNHLRQGILNPNDITLLLELKMDGMSVEADVTDEVISARTRGDTNLDLAKDLTPVLKGYKFPYCPKIDTPFGMKFEAILTRDAMYRLSLLKGVKYKNARNGIVGLTGSIDAGAYRDLITLVPLETSLDIDPITEIEFMNKYYTKDVYLPYAVVRGDYNTVLFQVYKFVKEAEKLRPISKYLYDGVVIHYVDPYIRQILGRVNSVNQYSIAIKFNPTVKQTVFRGYTFSIGQNGIVVPLAHYDPVEFLGTIHTKSSCHSYGRFMELNLAVGDVVDVAYVNDVMPYISRPYETYKGEFESGNTPVQFPSVCPCCGTNLVFTEDSAICPNFYCRERQVGRLTNMLDKLGIKGFSESAVRKLGLTSFSHLFNMTSEHVAEVLGPGNANNFMQALHKYINTPIQDYRVIGALGFTNLAAESWRKILKCIPIEVFIYRDNDFIRQKLEEIHGIGKKTISTIMVELGYFRQDIDYINHMPNILFTYNSKDISVRWTGCRDSELEEKLISLGINSNSSAGVSKATDILVVPFIGYTSSKTSKVGPNTFIVPLDEFKRNYQYVIDQVRASK